MENTVVWFDIPVTDIERAKEFYQAVIGAELTDMENGPARFAMFHSRQVSRQVHSFRVLTVNQAVRAPRSI